MSKYSPYWKEFGIDGVETMEQGEIRVYQYGDSELSLAIEYCADVSATDKVASKYFAFDNPRLKMVSEGRWEILDYDRLPRGKRIYDDDIKYRYYSGNMTYVEFFIKNYTFKIYEARCKCTENTRTYSFQVPMYKYKLKTNKAYFYNIFVTFDKEFNVINTEFKLTEDKDWIYFQLKGNNNEYLNEARFGDHFYHRWGTVEWNSDINEQIRIWSNDLILKAV